MDAADVSEVHTGFIFKGEGVYSSWTSFTLKIKTLLSFGTFGSTNPAKQPVFSAELNTVLDLFVLISIVHFCNLGSKKFLTLLNL